MRTRKYKHLGRRSAIPPVIAHLKADSPDGSGDVGKDSQRSTYRVLGIGSRSDDIYQRSQWFEIDIAIGPTTRHVSAF